MWSNGQPGFQVASHRLGYDSVVSCTAHQLKTQSGNVVKASVQSTLIFCNAEPLLQFKLCHNQKQVWQFWTRISLKTTNNPRWAVELQSSFYSEPCHYTMNKNLKFRNVNTKTAAGTGGSTQRAKMHLQIGPLKLQFVSFKKLPLYDRQLVGAYVALCKAACYCNIFLLTEWKCIFVSQLCQT